MKNNLAKVKNGQTKMYKISLKTNVKIKSNKNTKNTILFTVEQSHFVQDKEKPRNIKYLPSITAKYCSNKNKRK